MAYRDERYDHVRLWLDANRGVVIAILCVFVGMLVFWAFVRSDKHKRQAATRARIEQLGGKIGWDGDNHYYGAVLNGRTLGDTEVALLPVFDGFLFVDLDRSRVTDEGLRHLRGMRKLRRLSLVDTPVGDDGLAHLTDLPELTDLDLSSTQVTDAGAEHLIEMSQLRYLSLARTRLTDAGLARLQTIRSLHGLDVGGTQVTAGAIAALRRALPELAINTTTKDAE